MLRTDALVVERVSYLGLDREGVSIEHEPARQIVITTRGAFRWHVGYETTFVDANQVVFVRDGEASRDSHPDGIDVSCIVVTLSAELSRALFGPPLGEADPFRRRTALASNALQLGFASLSAAEEPAVAEERALELVGLAARCGPPRPISRLAHRAKELLSSSGRMLPLPEVAARLGVSPCHLTDSFRRSEGVPLVRYQQKLRLARALAELPHTEDLTTLALDLGFSSHSHFTTAFRSAMGLTPSRYRKMAKAPGVESVRILDEDVVDRGDVIGDGDGDFER